MENVVTLKILLQCFLKSFIIYFGYNDPDQDHHHLKRIAKKFEKEILIRLDKKYKADIPELNGTIDTLSIKDFKKFIYELETHKITSELTYIDQIIKNRDPETAYSIIKEKNNAFWNLLKDKGYDIKNFGDRQKK